MKTVDRLRGLNIVCSALKMCSPPPIFHPPHPTHFDTHRSCGGRCLCYAANGSRKHRRIDYLFKTQGVCACIYIYNYLCTTRHKAALRPRNQCQNSRQHHRKLVWLNARRVSVWVWLGFSFAVRLTKSNDICLGIILPMKCHALYT